MVWWWVTVQLHCHSNLSCIELIWAVAINFLHEMENKALFFKLGNFLKLGTFKKCDHPLSFKTFNRPCQNYAQTLDCSIALLWTPYRMIECPVTSRFLIDPQAQIRTFSTTISQNPPKTPYEDPRTTEGHFRNPHRAF